MFRIDNNCRQVVGQAAKRRAHLVNGGIPEFANRINWYFAGKSSRRNESAPKQTAPGHFLISQLTARCGLHLSETIQDPWK